MPKLIIGFVGPMASGKGVAGDYLIQKYSSGYHRFSSIIRDAMSILGIEESRENMQRFSLCVRNEFGHDLFAKALKVTVEKDTHEIICVDGIRRGGDIKYLNELPNFVLVYIDAPIEVRYQRMVARAENTTDKNKTFDQFVADHQADTELTIPPLKNSAKVTIDNIGTTEELFEKIDGIVATNK